MSETYETARDAANANPPAASASTVIIEYTENGVTLPQSDTLSPESAADGLTAYRASERDSRALSLSADFAEAIDRLRSAGVAISEVPGVENAPTLPEPVQLEQPAVQANGLPRDVAAALALPAVRDALNEQLGHAEAARVAYSQGLTVAQNWAQSALLVVAPELANVPIGQVPEALSVLAQVAPQRYAQVAALLDQVGKLQHAQNAQAAYEQQQRETWAKAEDAKLTAAIGPVSGEVAAEMISYAGEMGIDQANLVHLLRTENVLKSAAFQHVIVTACNARIAQRAAANWRTRAAPKAIPPVTKPGVSQPRQTAAAADIAQLSNRLSKSGSLRDAAALLAAKRRS